MINITVKSFSGMTAEELYSILRLRSKVFVVEQQCIYEDIDGRDQRSAHLLCSDKNGVLMATLRIVEKTVRFDEISIGRVVVDPSFRGAGLGKLILRRAVDYITNYLGESRIRISAQTHLRKFYEDVGFHKCSEEYDEDGISHIEMLYNA